MFKRMRVLSWDFFGAPKRVRVRRAIGTTRQLTVVITCRAASLGGPLNAMSTRVTLDLVSSTNSSIVLRKMSANIQKVQKALQDLREKKISLNPSSCARTRRRQVDHRVSSPWPQVSRPILFLLKTIDI
jgi:hypothetical protein